MAWKGAKGGGVKGVKQPFLKPAFPAAAAAPPNYKTTPCKFFAMGQCTRGADCTFLHPGAESPAPNYKTVPCKFWAIGQCAKGDACTFLHEGAEVVYQPEPAWQPPVYQAPAPQVAGTQAIPCKFFAEGRCAKGAACQFSHGGASPGKAYGKGYDSGKGKGFDSGKGKGFGAPPVGKGYGQTPFMGGGSLAKGEVITKGCKGKPKGKKGKSKLGGKGHLLPRVRISEAPITGQVVEWRGKFGWILPADPLEHEKASRHGGKIFVGVDDIGELEELAVGATVEFQVWEDDSGLGAEEVLQY